MEIEILSFDELTLQKLYAIMRLRADVFVVEQDCAYQDLDGLDEEATHMLGFEGGKLVAYARILKPGAYYTEPGVGRVVTATQVRSSGLGKHIFSASVKECKRQFPNQNIKIMAQTYLIDFYKGYGFCEDGAEFLEDGLPHVEMVLK